MAQNGQFWSFCRFFPIMRLGFIWNGHFHAIHNFSHLLPPKHLISSKLSKICISWGGRYIGKIFEFFNILDSFHTKLAKMTHNGKFCQKSQLDWLKMANFGHFVGFPHNSSRFLTFLIPFTPNWLKNDPQCQILPKKWVRLAQNGSSLRYLHFCKFCM